MNAESDCSRVSSKVVEVEGAGGEYKDTVVPAADVREIPTMGSSILMTETPVGGLSEMESVTLALPPPPQLVTHALLTPLQEERAKIPHIAKMNRTHFEFIHHPTSRIGHHVGRSG
jgi:hypothetical protein